MKKILALSVLVLSMTSLFAQQDSLRTVTQEAKPKKQVINLSNRANDHFLFQLGYTSWSGKPDTLNTGGFSKSVNAYFMFDFPFKTNPRMSVAIGPGISTDQIVFKKTYVGIKDITPTIQFHDQADTNHFKRSKLVTAYLEAPIELRFTADPMHNGSSFKFAIGVKVGTMIAAHTRNKNLQTSTGSTLNDYTMKEASKRFFNSNRLSGTARIGKGHFSLYGTYQITALFKDGLGPLVHPWSLGLTLSGL